MMRTDFTPVRRGQRRLRTPDVLDAEARIPGNLKALRVRAGLSQGDVARHFGISFQAVYKWESGQSRVLSSVIPALCHLYGCTYKDIFDGSVGGRTS